jgi:CRISPR-associated protein Csm1
MRVLITASGIQDYIFSINERQASKRLRGRSSRLGLVTDLCRLLLQRQFGAIDVKRDAGSRLEVEIQDGSPGLQSFLENMRHKLDSHSVNDLNGQVWFAIAEGAKENLHEDLSRRKLNLGRSILQSGAVWDEGQFVFTRRPNERALNDPNETAKHPLPDAALGRDLVRFDDPLIALEPCHPDNRDEKQIRVLDYSCEVRTGTKGDGIAVELAARENLPAQQVSKRLARYAPTDRNGDLLDFEAIADHSMGASFLGVLKADLDNLGATFETLANDESAARKLSDDLDLLFTTELKQVIDSKHSDGRDYSRSYVVYAGGDDLFMFGPWDQLIRFIDEFHHRLEAKTQQWKHHDLKLTLSAGFKLAHPKSPMRFLADDVEEAVKQAKGEVPLHSDLPPKNRIAVFERALSWEDLGQGLKWADRFIPALKDQSLSKGFLQRFLYYASQFRRYEAGHIDGLRMVPLLQNDWSRNREKVQQPLLSELDEFVKQLLAPMAEQTHKAWRIMDFASRFAIYAVRSKENHDG